MAIIDRSIRSNQPPGDPRGRKGLATLPARTDRRELLDGPPGAVAHDELAGNLRDIRRANRYFGGTGAVLDTLRPMLRELSEDLARPIELLDVATGSADIPLAILDQAEREGLDLRVTATDVQPEIVELARPAERPGRLVIERADALALPYPDGAFDIVTLSLALHHFGPDDAVLVLAEMRRVARHAVVVNDLTRSWPGYAAAWLFGHLLTRNRLTRHDAPLSVRRAYTPGEALELARAAGWCAPEIRRVRPFRYVMTGRRRGHADA